MYRCGVCGKCSLPGESRKTAVVQRVVPPGIHFQRRDSGNGRMYSVPSSTPARTEIAREVPLCSECHRKVEKGVSLQELLALYRSISGGTPSLSLPIRLGQPARVSPTSPRKT